MSKIRGVFPLFLATTFGIVNGVWVFGPAFKEQQENAGAKDDLVVSKEVDATRVEELRNIEAAVSRTLATQFALKTVEKPSSWWSNLNVWTRGPGFNNTGPKETSSKGSATEEAASKSCDNHTADGNTPPSAPSSGPTNSIVQRLAEKSAKDPDLKVLFKAVANGNASTDELNRFQGHIDELKRS